MPGSFADGGIGDHRGLPFTLRSEPVSAVLEHLRGVGESQDGPAKLRVRAREHQLGTRVYGLERALLYGTAPLSIAPATGELLYLLTLAARPDTVVEFGASLGFSTLHLASALRDLGAGSLISTELVAEKAQIAAQNLIDAGLDDVVQLRVGDALETLAKLSASVDLLFLDGSNDLYLPVLRLLERRLAPRALVVADMSEGDPHHASYREYVQNPDNGYMSVEIPLDAGVVVSARTKPQ